MCPNSFLTSNSLGKRKSNSVQYTILLSGPCSLCPSPPGRERTNTSESAASQQLSAGEDSIGSWSNLSFEDEHPDESSSFLHLSDRYSTSSML